MAVLRNKYPADDLMLLSLKRLQLRPKNCVPQYVCMYVCVYIYIYMYVCMCVYVCMCIYIYICVYIYINIYNTPFAMENINIHV